MFLFSRLSVNSLKSEFDSDCSLCIHIIELILLSPDSSMKDKAFSRGLKESLAAIICCAKTVSFFKPSLSNTLEKIFSRCSNK